MGTWHVPFKGRNSSGVQNQNFLWQDGCVYIMDNHRAAWWCWMRHIGTSERVSLFHIDRHRDALQSGVPHWLSLLPKSIHGVSIDDYLGYSENTGHTDICAIRWDNYLSLFLEHEKHRLGSFYMATHDDGDKPQCPAIEVLPWKIPENLDFWLEQDLNWIVNIDLDYFFSNDNSGGHCRLLSPEFVEEMCLSIKKHLGGIISVLTICLTPDDGGYSGGWASAEALCAEFCTHLGINFKLS